jgi:hypothetical protein
MKSLLITAASVTAILVASGCASTETASANTTQREEPVYRTGSNIPVHDKAPQTKEEKEKQADDARRSLQQMQNTGAGMPKSTN